MAGAQIKLFLTCNTGRKWEKFVVKKVEKILSMKNFRCFHTVTRLV